MTDRQKKADRFYLAGTLGAIALLVWIGLFVWINHLLPAMPESVHAAGTLARNLLNLATMAALAWAMISLIVHRNSGEFTLATWHMATTAGFFTSVIWLFFVPILIGLLAISSESTDKPDFNVVVAWGAAVIMAAFFVGFHLKRMRS